jgi:mRNA-degrading endonuclease toxin of MazEF toxin-antitoxin module
MMLAVADAGLRARLAALFADHRVEAAEPGPSILELLVRRLRLRTLILFEATPGQGALDVVEGPEVAHAGQRGVRSPMLERGEIWLTDLDPLRIRVPKGAGLKQASCLLIDQLRAIDNRRLARGPLARLPPTLMVRVELALQEVLDLVQ